MFNVIRHLFGTRLTMDLARGILPLVRLLVYRREAFADFFDQKVSEVSSATNGAPTPEARDILMADRFLSLAPMTSEIVCRMVNDVVNKFSMKG